jgi:transcriptional regulator with XRE-family HTH domain
MIKDRIREKRKALGLKQKELAKLIGVSAGNVSHWEQGITSPKGTNLLKLADVLKVSPDWLAGDSMNDSQPIKSVRNAWELPDDVDLSDAEFRDIMVPRLDEVSKDNYLGEANYNKLFPVRKELLQLYSLQPRHLGALVMPDTSMEPSISKGDMLLVDTSVKEIERDAKHIYALVKNKTTLLILRVKGDALGKLLWTDSRGENSATTTTEKEWAEYEVAGRVVMRTGAL